RSPHLTPFPYTTLFRSRHDLPGEGPRSAVLRRGIRPDACRGAVAGRLGRADPARAPRARLTKTYPEKTANTQWKERRMDTDLTEDRKSTRLNSSHDQIS